MSIRVLHAVAAAAVLSGAAAVAQTNDQSSREIEADETPITVVGCLQRESDYRRQNDSGKGGLLGTGLGRGNEYVLVDSAGDCSMPLNPGAAAYELTGDGEPDLEALVGRRVEISGMLKEADLTADGRAEGGFDPIGQDLRLREVNVSSFREVPMLFAQGGIDVADTEPQPVGTSGFRDDAAADEEPLPRTASPLAIAGLIGLLSAGGGIGVRAVRRRLVSLR